MQHHNSGDQNAHKDSDACIHKSWLLDPILSQLNLFHILMYGLKDIFYYNTPI
jgi:hypothetical protein